MTSCRNILTKNFGKNMAMQPPGSVYCQSLRRGFVFETVRLPVSVLVLESLIPSWFQFVPFASSSFLLSLLAFPFPAVPSLFVGLPLPVEQFNFGNVRKRLCLFWSPWDAVQVMSEPCLYS